MSQTAVGGLRRWFRCCNLKSVGIVCICVVLLYLFVDDFAPPIIFPFERWPKRYGINLTEMMFRTDAATNFEDVQVISSSGVESAYRSVFSRTDISCKALFKGDKQEQRKAREYMKVNSPETLTPKQLLRMTKDCNSFRRIRGYVSQPRSKQEADFPIAFSILIKGDADQAERLLRAIYAPQNYYCLHVDLKADPSIVSAMLGVSSCLNNVFVASKLESVYWGHISIMYAEINCIEDLLKFSWRYFINLSGQMFPAHSNAELVHILRLYDGANDVEGMTKSAGTLDTWMRTAFAWRLFKPLGKMFPTLFPHSSLPYQVTIYKGSNQVALTRAFVIYFMFSKKSRDLVEWFADTNIPDEHIWPTLNHNTHLYAPGSFKGQPDTKPFTVRGSIWSPAAQQMNWFGDETECQGKWVRKVCIFGIGDLPWLYRRPQLFVNKFLADYDWLAYDCVEELIHNRTVTVEGHQRDVFDLNVYRRLPFVRNKTLLTSIDEALRHFD